MKSLLVIYDSSIQDKVFKSNLEEAMTYDYVSIYKSAIKDFLKNKLEKTIMTEITEVKK